MPTKLPQHRSRTELIISDDSDDCPNINNWHNSKRAKLLPSSTTDSPANAAVMSTIKSEVDLDTKTEQPDIGAPEAEPNAQDEARHATQTAEAYATLNDASARLFKIGEKICHSGFQGGTIISSKWTETDGTFNYDILSLFYSPPRRVENINEAEMRSSPYTVGDVVEVFAFGKQVRRTIAKVLVDANGVFTYDVGSSLEARDQDIVFVAGRRR